MHILIGFLVTIGLLTTFYNSGEMPKDEVRIQTGIQTTQVVREQILPMSEIKDANLTNQSFDYSCGSASLATLLNYHLGEGFSEREVIHGLLKYGNAERIKERRAFSLLDMRRFLSILGYDGNGYTATVEDIRNPEYWPCLIPIELFGYRHFVVLKGVYDNHVFVADPWRGNSSYSMPKFEKIWYQKVIFLVTGTVMKPNKMLALTESDLMYISEDTGRRLVMDHAIPFDLPEELYLNDVPMQRQRYKP